MSQSPLEGAELCPVPHVHPAAIAAARAGLADDATYTALAELFGALADATRARIVHLLMEREWCTCDIAAVVGTSESSISQHLRVLRSLHLVRARRAGKFVYYRLDDAHVALLMRVSLTHLGEPAQAANAAHTPVARADAAHRGGVAAALTETEAR